MHLGIAVLNWYALYTKPNSERQVAEALRGHSIETYLPTVQVWRARRRRSEEEPLFSCYIFARVDVEATGISIVTWMPGLRYIVSCDGVPTPVPDGLVAYIRRRMEEVAAQVPTRLRLGDRVRIVYGPMKDLEAVFESHSGHERAQVLAQVLGRLAHCEVPTEWLESV